jgi:hypothetical protein
MAHIYASLDNKKADHQASVVDMEGMIANCLVSILIDPSSNLSYVTHILLISVNCNQLDMLSHGWYN